MGQPLCSPHCELRPPAIARKPRSGAVPVCAARAGRRRYARASCKVGGPEQFTRRTLRTRIDDHSHKNCDDDDRIQLEFQLEHGCRARAVGRRGAARRDRVRDRAGCAQGGAGNRRGTSRRRLGARLGCHAAASSRKGEGRATPAQAKSLASTIATGRRPTGKADRARVSGRYACAARERSRPWCELVAALVGRETRAGHGAARAGAAGVGGDPTGRPGASLSRRRHQEGRGPPAPAWPRRCGTVSTTSALRWAA